LPFVRESVTMYLYAWTILPRKSCSEDSNCGKRYTTTATHTYR
jgi:hypothetical protein